MARTRVKDAFSEVLQAGAEVFHSVGECVSVIPEAAKITVRNYDRNSTLEYLQDVQDAELNEDILQKNLAIIGRFSR